jgi:hypothetical protein
MSTNSAKNVSSLQEAIDAVESLSLQEQAMVLEIVQNRLIQQRRGDLVRDVAEARADYGRRRVRRGTVADIMAELDS